MPEPKSKNSLAASLYGTPRLPTSSSTPSPSRPGMPPSSLDDLNAQVSDSFSRPSRLNKLKLSFNLKTNRQVPVDKQSDGDSITSIGLLVLWILFHDEAINTVCFIRINGIRERHEAV